MGIIKKAINSIGAKEQPFQNDNTNTDNIKKAIQNLNQSMSEHDQRSSIPFEEFLNELVANPDIAIRNVFQVFHDMMKAYVGAGVDEYPDDPESINYVSYDCSQLFVEGVDYPFFADRLFSNRLVTLVEALKRGAQQNKIYIFKGPPGCGKSTFLNNLLRKFEEFANTDSGLRYETVWRFDQKILGRFSEYEEHPVLERLSRLIGDSYSDQAERISDNDNPDAQKNPETSIETPYSSYLKEDLAPY